MYEKEILEVYRYCNVRSFPIDCESIVAKLGYQMVTYQQYCEGNRELFKNLCSISNDSFIMRRKRLMFINSSVDRRRKRFSICHEIGHIVMLTDDEDEADGFASSILAPLPIVRMYGLSTADEISQKFDISISAANHVVFDLKKPFEDNGLLCDYFKEIEKEEWYKRMGLKQKRKTIARKAESYDVKLSDRQRMIADAYGMEWNDLQLARHDHELYFG